jgi:hypothetical protein
MFELITKFDGLSDMTAQKDGAGMLSLAGCRYKKSLAVHL